METKVIKPLLRSLFYLLCPFCPLFRGTGFCPLQTAPGRKSGKPADLCCVFCSLFRRWIFHRKKSQKPAFFLGTAVRNVLFSHPFAASWAMDPRASIQAARSLMVLGVCAFGGTLGGMLSF